MKTAEKNTKDLRKRAGMTQKEMSELLKIPLRTIEDWDRGARACAPYLYDLIEYRLVHEGKIKEE